jgi:hypothetical protein
MNTKSTMWMGLFTLLGMICGLALSVLIQPGNAAAQAPQPTPTAGGIIQGSSPAVKPGERPVNVAAPAAADAPVALAGKAFTYQGMLRQGGQPVNATCDLQFGVWDALAVGTQLGATQTVTSPVANGLFTVLLNATNEFGDRPFDGRAAWIETAVRCPSGSGSYTTLTPRQALTAAPLASGLAPHAIISADDTFSGNSALIIKAPVGTWSNPMGLEVHADPSNFVGTFTSAGVWGDSASGKGVWGTTNSGFAVIGSSGAAGQAGYFEGNVTVTGKLTVNRFHSTQLINSLGPLPITSAGFNTSGGTLMLFYSGSGYSNLAGRMIGMIVRLDGNIIDQTGIYANAAFTHLAFVPKQWVVTDIAAGSHTISLEVMNVNTLTDPNDIFEVMVTEMPY